MSKKKKEKIAVVIDDKDICRIVPFKPVDGKYEIKIDFLGNEFNTTCYRLFSHRPIEYEIDGSSNLEVSYHKGENAKPLTIHLKQKGKIEGKDRYTNLPLKRIQAPSINQLFPIPILKLEVPKNSSDLQYRPKGYHKLIKPDDCNVVEIYLAHKDFDFEDFGEKFPGMQISFMMLSFEIYTTNTVITDYQKHSNILPSDEPKCIMSSFDMLEDMKVIAIHYKDIFLESRREKINITFIENELSEAILSMMKIAYPNSSSNGEYDCVYLGAASLKDINQPVVPLARPSIGLNNVISDAFLRNTLTEEEKEKLYWHALKLRVQLRDALVEHQENSDKIKQMVFEKVGGLTKTIKYIGDCVENLNLLADEKNWFLSYSEDKRVNTFFIIARYLGMNQCKLYTRSFGQAGKEHDFYHMCLLYQDLFDIDVHFSDLNEKMKLDIKEEIVITPAEHHPVLAEHAEYYDLINKAGYERGPLKIYTLNEDDFGKVFDSDNKLLDRIYCKILSLMND